MVFECPDATEGALPSGLEIKKIFDRGRYTMERAEWIAAQHGLLGVASALASLVESEINEGVKAGVALLDPSDEGVHDLDWRELASADMEGEFGCAHVGEFRVHRHDSSPFAHDGCVRVSPTRLDPLASGDHWVLRNRYPHATPLLDSCQADARVPGCADRIMARGSGRNRGLGRDRGEPAQHRSLRGLSPSLLDEKASVPSVSLREIGLACGAPCSGAGRPACPARATLAERSFSDFWSLVRALERMR